MKQKKDFGIRPKCIIDGCERCGQFMGSYRKDGTPLFRKYCTPHHYQRQAEKKGLTITQWANSFHEYRKYRKDYCENVDGRLGFICTASIVWEGMLDVDHIDGNPENNTEENTQTLCKCCHAYKTNIYRDYATAGRKTLKESKTVVSKQQTQDFA